MDALSTDAAAFALALADLDGVGRVTVGRLLGHFGHYAGLRRYPREQVLARLKGTAHAARLVDQLHDEAAMAARLQAAADTLADLRRRQVAVVTCADPGWPSGVDALPTRHRPPLLYVFGDPALLQRPLVACFARPPLDDALFERAQAAVRHLLRQDVVPASGLAHGFDVVIHKLAAGADHPSVAVLNAGMGQLPGPMRPTASGLHRHGGALVSPFPLRHGPFEHDDKERALLLAALATACVFVDPPEDSPEALALNWAREAGRPVFGVLSDDADAPEAVHPLRADVDLEWLVAAARHPADG